VLNSAGPGYTDVDRWSLTQDFPDPGDGTRAGLWLLKLGHTVLVGGSSALPDIEFTPIQKSNRVDVTGDFAAAMKWMRIARVRTDSGATIGVTYSDEDCQAGQTPAPHENARRCYPVRWTPEGYRDPVTDWFHKYVVTKVYEDDVTGGVAPFGSPQVEYNYRYHDGAAWHYNDDDGLKTQVVIPTAETGIGGIYNLSTTYNADDSVATSTWRNYDRIGAPESWIRRRPGPVSRLARNRMTARMGRQASQ
jgi:hypothetical protein